MTLAYTPQIDELANTEVGELVSAESYQQELIAAALVEQLLADWELFDSYYDGPAIQEYASSTAGLVRAAQREAGAVTEQHLREQFARMNAPLPNKSIVDLPEDLRLGATTEDVYQRPVRKLRYIIAELEQAVAEDQAERERIRREYEANGRDARKIAAERLKKQAETDMQLARATAAQQILYAVPETKVGTTIGWRRIIHPEISAVCGLCVAASDRTYKRIQRMDIHPGCKCTVLPIIVDDDGVVSDPGRDLNAADLTRIYAAAGGEGQTSTTDSRKLAATRIQVRENGELGQILMADGSQYKGPKTAVNQLSPEAAQRRLDSIDTQLTKLRAQRSQSQWTLDRIDQLEELRAAA